MLFTFVLRVFWQCHVSSLPDDCLKTDISKLLSRCSLRHDGNGSKEASQMVRQTTPNHTSDFQESKGAKDMGKTECSWTCVHGEHFSDVQVSCYFATVLNWIILNHQHYHDSRLKTTGRILYSHSKPQVGLYPTYWQVAIPVAAPTTILTLC